ncbi:unnamed protein product [Brassica oleracea]
MSLWIYAHLHFPFIKMTNKNKYLSGLKKMKSKGTMDVVTHLPPQLPTLSDLEARMQLLRVSALEESQGDDDTFAQRAEWFYHRRPLLLSLCLDLYNGYLTLLGRSHQTRPNQQLIHAPSHPNHLLQDEEDCVSEVDSGSEISSESTLSFQQMEDPATVSEKVDELVSQLVTANLDKEILQDELLNKEEKFCEAAKTIELLKKFVMLLEMEKEVAVEENANLGYKVTSLLEENRELATEALFMKNEAVGLARCVLKMRDDHFHKVCILQNRIYSLQASQNSEPVYDKVSTGCFGLDKYKTKKKKENKTEDKTGFKWLKKLNNISLFTKENKGKEITMLHQGSWFSSLMILSAIFSLTSLMLKSEGANHTVGDSSGWELLTNYTNWTEGREFHVGDVLVFNYNKDQHNVMQVNSTAYADCGRDNYISLFTNGNDSIIISEVGEHWFICAMYDHCENGQKLSINATL